MSRSLTKLAESTNAYKSGESVNAYSAEKSALGDPRQRTGLLVSKRIAVDPLQRVARDALDRDVANRSASWESLVARQTVAP
jgi:hypothetical protein